MEGDNIHSDYRVQERLPHSSFAEPSVIACCRENGVEPIVTLMRRPKPSLAWLGGLAR